MTTYRVTDNLYASSEPFVGTDLRDVLEEALWATLEEGTPEEQIDCQHLIDQAVDLDARHEYLGDVEATLSLYIERV